MQRPHDTDVLSRLSSSTILKVREDDLAEAFSIHRLTWSQVTPEADLRPVYGAPSRIVRYPSTRGHQLRLRTARCWAGCCHC